MAKKEHTEKKENVLKEAIERTRDHGFYLKEGKEVTIFFLDGTSITGIFNYIGRYEIFLIIKDKDGVEEEATIFKNAIKYII